VVLSFDQLVSYSDCLFIFVEPIQLDIPVSTALKPTLSTWLQYSQQKTPETIELFDVFKERFVQAQKHVLDPSPSIIYSHPLISRNYLVAQPFEKMFAGTFNFDDRNVSATKP